MIKGTKLLKEKSKKQDFYIENILPEGVTILAGATKSGKTYLTLEMAVALTEKEKNFLGNTTNLTKVLYYSNETKKEEIKKRLKILGLTKSEIKFDFTTKPSIQEIEEEILQNKKSINQRMLVIIDTFQNLVLKNKYDNNNYQDTYEKINEISRISEQKNVGFLIVHHINKTKNEENIFDSINGSVALTAATETNIILDRVFEQNYQLHIQSRYIESQKLSIKRLDNGFFINSNEELLIESNDVDINTLIKFLAKQENQIIEDTSTNIVQKANLKFTTPNILYKKLCENEQLLKQCNIFFQKRRSNGKNLIKIELNENEESEETEDEM